MLLGKVVEFMMYSGKFSEHVGVSGYDVQLRANTRRAVNVLCAWLPRGTSEDTKGYKAMGPFFDAPPISAVGNMDVCKVRAAWAQALFSAGRFDKAREEAVQAVQGLALAGCPSPQGGGGGGYCAGARGCLPNSVFQRSHMTAPTVHEALRGQSSVCYGGDRRQPPHLFVSYAEAYQQALALVRYGAKADFDTSRSKGK